MEPVNLITFYELLEDGYTTAQLASAVERHGVYGWDRYGRYGAFKKTSAGTQQALDVLAQFYAASQLDQPGLTGSPYDALFAVSQSDSHPLDLFGWPADAIPTIDRTEVYATPPRAIREGYRPQTLLRIIGGLLALITKPSANRGKSEAQVINLLVARYGTQPGISTSNLEKVFPDAKACLKD